MAVLVCEHKGNVVVVLDSLMLHPLAMLRDVLQSVVVDVLPMTVVEQVTCSFVTVAERVHSELDEVVDVDVVEVVLDADPVVELFDVAEVESCDLELAADFFD